MHRARSNLSADEGEWINSDKLEAGDLVLKPDGSWVKVLSINHAFGEASVYNFEVERNHDYFVGSAGVLVHNIGDCRGFPFSSKSVRDAVKALEGGAKEVTVNSADEAGEVFLRRFQGEAGAGYRNTTEEFPRDSFIYPNGKNGTYHWDLADDLHPSPHLQVHDYDGNIFRINH